MNKTEPASSAASRTPSFKARKTLHTAVKR